MKKMNKKSESRQSDSNPSFTGDEHCEPSGIFRNFLKTDSGTSCMDGPTDQVLTESDESFGRGNRQSYASFSWGRRVRATLIFAKFFLL